MRVYVHVCVYVGIPSDIEFGTVSHCFACRPKSVNCWQIMNARKRGGKSLLPLRLGIMYFHGCQAHHRRQPESMDLFGIVTEQKCSAFLRPYQRHLNDDTPFYKNRSCCQYNNTINCNLKISSLQSSEVQNEARQRVRMGYSL